MQRLLDERRVKGVEVDSAGTSGYHVGELPDRRARQAAKRRGVQLSGSSRRFDVADFERFDYVVAMDRSNLADLQDLAPNRAARDKVSLLRDHDKNGPRGANVPDPYYGGDGGFDEVLDICEKACLGLLETLRAEHGL